MRSHLPFQLRVEMWEKVRVGKQYPVKETDIINLHSIQHEQETSEEFTKAKIMLDSVPSYPESDLTPPVVQTRRISCPE